MEKRLPLPVGTVLQGRYRIVRQFGHGGFGAVYEAVDDEINLSFALKETFYAANEELRQAFKREAKMLASLSHDAFPRISHYFTENDGCFLVMELIRGNDLDQLLAKQNIPFEQNQVLEWADQILDALEDLHSSGIVHRDIKPSNLKLTPKGKIKLLDFGIAKGAIEGETTLLSTVGSLAAATLQYAPLEQVLKASPQYQMMLSVVSSDKVEEVMKQGTDAASDIYALAATLYQMLTKQLPADAPTRALAIWSGQHDRLIPAHQINARVSKEVSDVLQKALSLDRRDRFQTASEMRQMLKDAAKPVEPVKPEPVIAPEPLPTEPSPFYVPPTEPSPRPFKPETETASPPIIETPPTPAPSKTDKTHIYASIIGIISVFTVLILAYLIVPNINSKSPNSNTNTSSNKITNSIPNIPADAKYELAQTLTGHSNSAYSAVFSPDGKTIVSGSSDNTIKLWDAVSGNLKQTLTGHSDFVVSIAFSPDGKTFASGSVDNTIKLWDASSGALKQTLSGHSNWVRSVAFSPDGKTVASGSNDKTIKLWDAASGALKQTLSGHSDWVYSIAFSPDGKTIASSSLDKTVKLWDAVSGTLKQTLTGHSDSVDWVAFSPDSKMIASASVDKTVKLWDASNGALKQTLSGHDGVVSAVTFSPDGKTIASAGYDKTIKLWDAASGALKQTLSGHSDSVLFVAFSPDGKAIASASADKTIKLWRLKE